MLKFLLFGEFALLPVINIKELRFRFTMQSRFRIKIGAATTEPWKIKENYPVNDIYQKIRKINSYTPADNFHKCDVSRKWPRTQICNAIWSVTYTWIWILGQTRQNKNWIVRRAVATRWRGEGRLIRSVSAMKKNIKFDQKYQIWQSSKIKRKWK
jgi:hypothetical protein